MLISSIISHEVGHAIDWLNPEFRFVPGAGRSYEWNAETYATNFHEARQFAEQINGLLAKVGDPHKVLQILSGSSPFRFPAALIPVAKAFLGIHESFLPKIGAGLLAATSMFGGDHKTKDTTPIVTNQKNEYIKEIAQKIKAIVKLMRFRNFIEEPK